MGGVGEEAMVDTGSGLEGKFIVRTATEEDLKAAVRLIASVDWHINPYDLHCVYKFQSGGFFVGELDGEVVGHIDAISYPGHLTSIGAFVVKKELRKKGLGRQIWNVAWRSVDHADSLTLVGASEMVPMYKSFGFQSVWSTILGMVDPQNVLKAYSRLAVPPGVSCKPIQDVDFDKLLKYDTAVFGASRRKLLEAWISIPGSLGWVAVNGSDEVIGYTTVKQVISGAGTEIGLAMTPLYANDDVTARLLLKVASETYVGIAALPRSPFELFYSEGGSFGDHASRLMSEVEAQTVHVGEKMFTKGIPPGTRLDRMYGLLSVAFD